MNPGLYIINTSVSSLGQTVYPFYVGEVSVIASGVTIVITSSTGSWPSETMAFDNGGPGTSFNLTAPTPAQVAAQTTSPKGIAGVAIWVDPNWPSATPANSNGNTTMTFSEGANATIEGAIVAPSQNVSFQNGANTNSTCTQLIAYSIVFTAGISSFSTTGCSALGVLPIGGTTKVQLVE
jgi:hypothetical protein